MWPAYTVVTYATHSQGMFDALRTDERGILVGGWGTPWKNFMDKFRFMESVAAKLPAEHILIFIDGFDTKIAQDPRIAVERFVREFPGCRFLISSGVLESKLPLLMRNRLFNCQQNCINTGLYMGYASDVARILRKCLRVETDDDQYAMQVVLSTHVRRDICVDVDRRIFCNLTYGERLRRTPFDTVFMGYNATLEPSRHLLHKYQLYASKFSHEFLAIISGIILGYLAFRYVDRSYRCHLITEIFAFAFCLVVTALLFSSRGEGRLFYAAFGMVSAMFTFHFAYFFKSKNA